MAQFSVSYKFHATASEIIEAETLEDATAQINARIEAPGFEIDPEQIDDVDFHIRQMRRVVRGGQVFLTTHLRPGETEEPAP